MVGILWLSQGSDGFVKAGQSKARTREITKTCPAPPQPSSLELSPSTPPPPTLRSYIRPRCTRDLEDDVGRLKQHCVRRRKREREKEETRRDSVSVSFNLDSKTRNQREMTHQMLTNT